MTVETVSGELAFRQQQQPHLRTQSQSSPPPNQPHFYNPQQFTPVKTQNAASPPPTYTCKASSSRTAANPKMRNNPLVKYKF
jgi:hypothetical protein